MNDTYTEAEKDKLDELIDAACEAEEIFDVDELERFAETLRAKREEER